MALHQTSLRLCSVQQTPGLKLFSVCCFHSLGNTQAFLTLALLKPLFSAGSIPPPPGSRDKILEAEYWAPAPCTVLFGPHMGGYSLRVMYLGFSSYWTPLNRTIILAHRVIQRWLLGKPMGLGLICKSWNCPKLALICAFVSEGLGLS